MLYPKKSIDVAARLNELPSGHIGLLPLNLAPGQTITISLRQIVVNPNNLPQDRSMRAWISTEPGGRSLTEATTITVLHLTSLNASVISLMSAELVTDDTQIGLAHIIRALPNQQYWLNVLNLVNESNSFAIEVN